MDNAFVINLDSKKESFEKIKQLFLPYGIACERFSAIEHARKDTGKTLSFLSLIARAKKENWPWIMILEDDCIARESMKQWPAILDYLIKNQKRWDVFLGGASLVHPAKIQTDWKSVPSNLNIIECYSAFFTHFSIFNQSSYDTILAWNNLPATIEERPSFDFFVGESPLRLWTSSPFLAWQEAHDGTDHTKFFENAERRLSHFSTEIKKCLKYRLLHLWKKAIG